MASQLPFTAPRMASVRSGCLPENDFELPANHRHTILALPDLTPGDIEYYCQRFTEVRKRDQLARLQGLPHSAGIQDMLEQTERSAALG